MNPLELRLINDNQRDFPLCHAPFAQLGEQLGIGEDLLLWMAEDLVRKGVVSRVGPVFAPHAVGVSTLAALQVPAERIDEVAALVNRFAEVNHNYLRDHPINLWFVVTAQDEARLDQTLADIERQAGCGSVLRCPLVEEYRIDLGFDLTREHAPRPVRTFVRQPLALNAQDQQLVGALQAGLPLVRHPYEAIAAWLGIGEHVVLDRLAQWVDAGVIRRLGFIVRHHELGYRANAMVVWQVPVEQAGRFGHCLRQASDVTLCYQREASPPRWPYNLYCMIHGRDRTPIQHRIEALTRASGLSGFKRDVLFSTVRFKQRGARYAATMLMGHG